MDFKAIREERDLTLKDVSELAGYSISTISDFERTGEGSQRLKEKLLQIYNLKKGFEPRGGMVLHEAAGESELDIWKRRAKTAERDLAELRKVLRALSDPVSSKLDKLVDGHIAAEAASLHTAGKR